MYATKPQTGFAYIKSNKGFYGITPQDASMISVIANKIDKHIEEVEMDTLSEEIKGKNIQVDPFYQLLFKLNIFLLSAFAIYLGWLFPGSDASRFMILYLVLAIGLFFFNLGNAGRLYNFSNQGGYILLVISLAVTGIFFILAFSHISL